MRKEKTKRPKGRGDLYMDRRDSGSRIEKMNRERRFHCNRIEYMGRGCTKKQEEMRCWECRMKGCRERECKVEQREEQWDKGVVGKQDLVERERERAREMRKQ